MARRGSELYTLTTEKFRELKASYGPQLKLKIRYLDFERDPGRHYKIIKLTSSRTESFELPRHIKFEIYTLHKIRKSK